MILKGVFVLYLLVILQEIQSLDIAPNSDRLICKEPEPVAKLYHHTGTEKILLGNGSDIELDPNLPTFFVTHGWRESSNVKVYVDIANALLNETESNVILVDYEEIASQILYVPCAPKMIQLTGELLGRFIADAHQNGKLNLTNINLIGHSLGGHVSGIAGKEVFKHTGEKVRRISALDPAGPLFAIPIKLLPGSALRPTDAIFVDALHTSILIGTIEKMGTVDIYANGIVSSTLQLPCKGSPSCSHSISKEYYLESISSCGILATNTKNNSLVVPYGYHMPEDISGIFSFTPNSKKPYGKGDPECV